MFTNWRQTKRLNDQALTRHQQLVESLRASGRANGCDAMPGTTGVWRAGRKHRRSLTVLGMKTSGEGPSAFPGPPPMPSQSALHCACAVPMESKNHRDIEAV